VECRAHKRYIFEHQAKLTFDSSHPIQCRIMNYCAGGVLVNLDTNLAELAAEKKLNLFGSFTLEFELCINEECQTFMFSSHIRRMEGKSVGIEFFQPPETAIALLNDFISKRSVINADHTTPTTSKEHTELIDNIYTVEQAFWINILNQFFEDVDTQLLKLADHAQTNQQQALCFEAINQLKTRRKKSENFIGRHVSEYLNTPVEILKSTELRPGDEENELKVLDKNIFEDWLEVQMIISAAEADYLPQLQTILQHLSQLYKTDINALNNPLGPHVICQTFRQSMTEGDLPRPILTVIYQCFQRSLNTHLSEFYAEIIDLFLSKGFTTPELNRTNSNEIQRQKNTTSELTNQKDISPDSAPNKAKRTQLSKNTYGTLQALKRLQRKESETGFANQSNTYFSLDEINNAFSKLSASKINEPDSKIPLRDIFQESVKSIDNGVNRNKQVSSDQLDLVDIVDDLFNLMYKTDDLDEEVRIWIRRLRIPLLKVILNEPDFLNNDQHPARQVIDQLIQIGSVDRVSNKSLERTVKRHIDHIVSEYDQNNEIFSIVSSTLKKLIDRQEHAFKRNAERVAKTYEGQEKLAFAKHHVLSKLVQLMVGRPIPRVTLDLVNEGWRSLLVITCVREGIHSEDLNEFFMLLEAIVMWTHSHQSDDVHTGAGNEFELDLEAPAILELINQQLSNSSAGIIKHETLLSELKSLLFDKRQPTLITIEESDLGFDISLEHEVFSETDRELQNRDINIPSIPSNSRWLERVKNMKVGDWVENQDEHKKVKRMRLIWTADDAYKFVFVNHQGMKEIEFDAERLVQQLDAGTTILVNEDEISFVDKSLFNTVQTVYEQMAFRATHDPLTELIERHEFEKYLDRALTKSKKNASTHALCYIDINQFSIINNNNGYEVGDNLLKAIAMRLKSCLDSHVVARIGGNEYGVLLNNCDESEAVKATEKIRVSINNQPFEIDKKSLDINISIGFEMISPESLNVTTILKHANLACLTSKQTSGNKVVEYQEDDSDQVHHESLMHWVEKVDEALATNSLLVRCQKIAPVINPESDSPHYEILLGVLNEEGKLTSPEPFIEAAEQFNRMPKVDRWVVNSAFEWMEKNQAKVNNLHGFSINLSGHSINDNDFLPFLLEKITSSPITSEKICFEVTETATISNLNYAADFINEVKKTGCKFSLDDFGTGLASYEYLQKLPVDYLKIDGIFIKDIASNTNNYAMVKSINELGHFLGKETIAEFVENDQILEILKEIGVDHAQGYGIEKPILLDTL